MITLLLSLILVPQVTLAQDSDMTLRDHAVLRAVERMGIGTHFGIRNNFVRLGHNVRTRRMSPRRMRQSSAATVVAVIDGSVIQVERADGEMEVVRTLGSEAPLINTGSQKQQCFALEAREKLRNMILGKQVELEKDRNFHRDNYGRLLRYVRLASMDINGWMIWNGYSFADQENQHRRISDYHSRQQDAMDQKRGLWGHFCEYNPDLETIDVLP